MARLAYPGIGEGAAAVKIFTELTPHAVQVRTLQAKCWPESPDDAALQIIIDGLDTAAYHFTRRPHFYEPTRVQRSHGRNFYEGLGERPEAIAAFETLAPCWARLRSLQSVCRPFGRDWLALDIPKRCLETAAYHVTRRPGFYGAKGDSAGPNHGPDW